MNAKLKVEEFLRERPSLQFYIVFYLQLHKFFLKNEFENTSILIFDALFESYQRVRIYTYSVNDLGLKKYSQ